MTDATKTAIQVTIKIWTKNGYNTDTLVERSVAIQVPENLPAVDELKGLLNREFAQTKEAYLKFPQPELPQAQRLEEIE